MPTFSSADLTELTSLVIAALVFGGYELFLCLRTRRDPAYTVQAQNSAARSAWVETIMAERRDILAVQTLRNSTMAATFLASSALLLIIGVLTLTGRGDSVSETWHSLNVLGGTSPTWWLVKLLFLLVDLLVAFFSFTLAVRMFNHVGYLVNVPRERLPAGLGPIQVAHHLNRAAASYTRGMRAYYLIIPLLFWLFGAQFLPVAMAGLVVVLHRLDRAPEASAE